MNQPPTNGIGNHRLRLFWVELLLRKQRRLRRRELRLVKQQDEIEQMVRAHLRKVSRV